MSSPGSYCSIVGCLDSVLLIIFLQTCFDDNNVIPLPVENDEITCIDGEYVLAVYDKICYIGKILENDLNDKMVQSGKVVKHSQQTWPNKHDRVSKNS
jgi:hypothetical protein